LNVRCFANHEAPVFTQSALIDPDRTEFANFASKFAMDVAADDDRVLSVDERWSVRPKLDDFIRDKPRGVRFSSRS
jgi:hypothetical protein